MVYMEENKQKPIEIAKITYNKCSDLYSSVTTNTPHNQLKNDMDMIYGMGGLFLGLMISGFSLQYIFTFTVLTVVGLAGLFLSMTLLKYSSTKVRNSFNQ